MIQIRKRTSYDIGHTPNVKVPIPGTRVPEKTIIEHTFECPIKPILSRTRSHSLIDVPLRMFRLKLQL